MDDEARQAIIDAEHLKLLRWGYFISAGLSACFSVFGLLYAGVGAFIANVPVKAGQHAPPEHLGLFFAILGISLTVIMLSVAAVKLRVAKALRERNHRTLCYVVAVLALFGVPFGTFLGIATLLVLSRPSVANLFD